MKTKLIYRIWENGGNMGYPEYNNFEDSLNYIYIHINKFDGKEILITKDIEKNNNLISSKHVCKINKRR